MSTFYEKGPMLRTEDAQPVDCYRVHAFYRDGRSEAAICDRGKWWGFYHRDEVPLSWHHMHDHRMVSNAETGGPKLRGAADGGVERDGQGAGV